MTTATPPLVPPIAQSAAYVMRDVDHVERVYEAVEPGYTYGREGHPNAADLAARIAQLENTEAGIVCGSGMGAMAAVLATFLKAGDRVVAGHQLYGRTSILLTDYFAKLGVDVALIDTGDLAGVERALSRSAHGSAHLPPLQRGGRGRSASQPGGSPAQAPCRGLLLFEMVSNPLLRVADAAALAEIAHRHGAMVVVDNTFPTPLGFRPAEHGADLVVHSLTKLIAGHSDSTLGAVCGRRDHIQAIARTAITWGFAASPFECWLADRGLVTLPLRLERATANARRLADFLSRHPQVRRVIYPGRSDHPDHALAVRQFGDRQGNMVAFELAGGREAANGLFRALKLVPFSPTLGHHATIAMHPATTSHRTLSPEARAALGMSDGLVRVSVGIEHADDLEADFGRALDATAV